MGVEIRIVETKFRGVFTDSDRLFTRNMVPTSRVYGERLYSQGEDEYREWMPGRSKLAAYLKLGGRCFPFSIDTRVLYLGAASGTTASHISDIVTDGTVYCVEVSPRSFRDLVALCERRKNMVPILADATRPEDYTLMVENIHTVYQDVAQKNQTSILIKNMDVFGADNGMIAIKARSEDVTKSPEKIFRYAESNLKKLGFKVVDLVPLEPFEKDHAMIAVKRK
ncbi:MAG: fibrillarin-like rRNA/tRNA 2'-O-methyltransferase [Methanomassiliicoccales archaeon]|jgi:fibrillarin-like pre-rRNA processing protein